MPKTINSFAFEAWTTKELLVFAENTWRPYIHVQDMSLLIQKILKTKKQQLNGPIFNAGATELNYTKRELVEILSDLVKDLKVTYVTNNDRRDYRVGFKKIEDWLKFKPQKNVKDGFVELLNSFRFGLLTKNDYDANNLEAITKYFGKKGNEYLL